MQKSLISASALAVLILVVLGANYLNQKGKDRLTFSNTMEWNRRFLDKSTGTPRYIPGFKDSVALFAPPANSSIHVKREIETLLVYQKNRTEAQISKIKEEILPETTIFGGQTMDSYFSSELHPKTASLLSDAFSDLSIVLFYEKNRFNRVRPAFLDSRVKPAIEIPGHPAYPSGHSTQLHFLALFLGETRPNDKENLWAEADAVAKNREIAGLHYPSDSAAGAMLAEQVFELLMANPKFKARFDDARGEWR